MALRIMLVSAALTRWEVECLSRQSSRLPPVGRSIIQSYLAPTCHDGTATILTGELLNVAKAFWYVPALLARSPLNPRLANAIQLIACRLNAAG